MEPFAIRSSSCAAANAPGPMPTSTELVKAAVRLLRTGHPQPRAACAKGPRSAVRTELPLTLSWHGRLQRPKLFVAPQLKRHPLLNITTFPAQASATPRAASVVHR